ncbi:MAG: VOC family protein [Terriglobales bacterium]
MDETDAPSTCQGSLKPDSDARAKRTSLCRGAPPCVRGTGSDLARLRFGTTAENDMQKITPFLWFDGQAEEAANFYTSIFKNSKILNTARYGDAGPGPKGTVMTVTFQLEGQNFMALNGGPHYTFSPAISFFVDCETQAEVDELWEKLSAGGKDLQCGWLKDKFGLSWQIIPKALMELMQDKDPVKSQRVFKAMLQMTRIDVEGLKRAYRGE